MNIKIMTDYRLALEEIFRNVRNLDEDRLVELDINSAFLKEEEIQLVWKSIFKKRRR